MYCALLKTRYTLRNILGIFCARGYRPRALFPRNGVSLAREIEERGGNQESSIGRSISYAVPSGAYYGGRMHQQRRYTYDRGITFRKQKRHPYRAAVEGGVVQNTKDRGEICSFFKGARLTIPSIGRSMCLPKWNSAFHLKGGQMSLKQYRANL